MCIWYMWVWSSLYNWRLNKQCRSCANMPTWDEQGVAMVTGNHMVLRHIVSCVQTRRHGVCFQPNVSPPPLPPSPICYMYCLYTSYVVGLLSVISFMILSLLAIQQLHSNITPHCLSCGCRAVVLRMKPYVSYVED